ncbi:MAG TPA: hypothetical protein VKG91_04205 [Roseiarcus sp.]|nr:hypothetical protein [Roseiarcus sp.]
MAEARADAPEKEKAGDTLKLQVALGNALMTVHGQGAPEALAAFERARVTVSAVKNAPERLVVTYGLYAGAYLRGELGPMREHATAFLGGVAAQPDSPEAGVAHRAYGITAWCGGNFADARRHLEQALAIFNPNRDRDLAFSFGHDPGVAAMAYLSLTLWPLGEVDRARRLVADMMRRTTEITHVGTICFANMHAGYLEMMRGDPIQTDPFANALARLARGHDLKMWTAFGVFLEGWTAWQAGARDAGLAGMRDGVSKLAEQEVAIFDGLIKTKLAQAEADDGAIVAALTIIDEAIAVSERTGHRWYDAEIRRTRGEILFKQDSENPAPAEDAFLTAIAISKRQSTRSFELRAALSLAKLYRATGRPAGAHAVLGPALEDFSPTPEMPEIAEAQAMLAALSETDEVRKAATLRRRQIELQLSYANALIALRGHGAAETTAAFARARELAAGVENPMERMSIYYGLWLGSFVRGGELAAMREASSEALALAEWFPGTGGAAVAHRLQGLTHWFQGDFRNAKTHLERALDVFDPVRDRDLAYRFGQDVGVAFMTYLSLALWPLGEIARARELQAASVKRARETDHVPTMAFAACYRSIFEMLRNDARTAEPFAAETFRLGQAHSLPMFLGYGATPAGWARASLGDVADGLALMREGFDTLRINGFALITPYLYARLAEIEADLGEKDAALTTLDLALAEIERTEHRTFDAEVHRIRGEILLRSAPADTTPAEQAFKAAIGIARGQGARSFELRAALSLAKLYQSAGRPADAHGVLAPALESFSPMPEMPEIAEAHALLAALAETDEVRNTSAFRKRQIDLQLSLGNALIATRGYGAPETQAAFAKARDLAAKVENLNERYAIYYGLFIGSLIRGESASSREIAEIFLRETAGRPSSGEFGVAHRLAGLLCYFSGDYVAARGHFETALGAFDTERDRDFAFRFGQDPAVATKLFLGLTLWALGDVQSARSFAEEAMEQALNAGHVNTIAYAHTWKGVFEMARRDVERTGFHAGAGLAIAREHGLDLWLAYATALRGWAAYRSGDRDAGLEGLREGLAQLRKQKTRMLLPFLLSLAAEVEVEADSAQFGLSMIDGAVAEASETSEHQNAAEAHRIRGEILLKCDSANPAPAAEAFLTAIAVAQRQKARSYQLRAAISLAKLYQSTARLADAHAVLAPALEGFSPTPEMPEIAEAQALLERLA